MYEIVEEITMQARRSRYIDQNSGVSARFSLANFRTMVASAPATRRYSSRITRHPSDQLTRTSLQQLAWKIRARHDGRIR